MAAHGIANSNSWPPDIPAWHFQARRAELRFACCSPQATGQRIPLRSIYSISISPDRVLEVINCNSWLRQKRQFHAGKFIRVTTPNYRQFSRLLNSGTSMAVASASGIDQINCDQRNVPARFDDLFDGSKSAVVPNHEHRST
ncbi:MAG TPA: hypothetical protein VMV70_02760 [Gallionella sp.]|nr:hypothetical protein [Gallionella sp.]